MAVNLPVVCLPVSFQKSAKTSGFSPDKQIPRSALSVVRIMIDLDLCVVGMNEYLLLQEAQIGELQQVVEGHDKVLSY